MKDGNLTLDSSQVAPGHLTEQMKAVACTSRLAPWLRYSELACLPAQSDPDVFVGLDDAGRVATVLKNRQAKSECMEGAVRSLATLNRIETDLARDCEILAATDVTGLGWMGHSRKMARGCAVRLSIHVSALPLFEGAIEAARLGAVPAGLLSNRKFVECVLAGGEDAALAYKLQTRSGE